MAVSTVRPDDLISGSFTVTGAANAWTALNDNSDSTFIRKTGTGPASTILRFADLSIGASQTVRQVRIRARVQTPTTSGKINFQLGTRVDGVNYFTAALAVRGQVATGEVVGQWYSSAPDGGAWTQSKINNLRAQITEYRDTTDRAFVYELYIDVDVANQATVTVTAPTGTITTTAKPDVAWSVSDPDGDFASYYQVKVFSAAEFGAPAFEPTNSTATWDSGQISGTDISTTVGTYLTNGSYRVYVRTAKSINGVAFWSGWAFSSITISLSPPTVPTLSLAYTTGENKVTVTATGAAAPAFDFQTFELQRTADSGVTWTGVRYASEMIPNGAFLAQVIDNEAPRGQVVGYRVRSIGTSGTNVQASAWSATSNVTTVNDGTWVLKTLEPTAQVVTNVQVTGPDSWDVPEQVGVFRPIGRVYPVVIAGALNAHTGSYTILATSTTEVNNLAPLLAYQGILLILTPFGDQKYIRITNRSVQRTGTQSRPRYEYSLDYVEVEA